MRNYTVFGREVNLASRLESASGRGRIFIGQTTYEHLQRDDPALAAKCLPLTAQKLKGFLTAVEVYEVPWRAPDGLPNGEELVAGAAPQGTGKSVAASSVAAWSVGRWFDALTL